MTQSLLGWIAFVEKALTRVAEDSPSLAAIVLAAGSSSRMGRAKQLLPWGGVSLVRRAAMAAVEAGCSPVVVVLGSGADAVRVELAGVPVWVVNNARWEAGMGGSIHAGVGAVSDESLDGVLISLCDQPGVDMAALQKLIDGWVVSGKPIAAAGYAGGTGAPAIFDRSLFDELLAMDDTTGAKKLLADRGEQVFVVDLPEAAADIDTPDDYAAALAKADGGF